MRDAQGFDPDETYTQPDNPFWDCTDAAHPAWWRGNDSGCDMTIKMVNGWLNIPLEELKKEIEKSYMHPDFTKVREMIYELRSRQ